MKDQQALIFIEISGRGPWRRAGLRTFIIMKITSVQLVLEDK